MALQVSNNSDFQHILRIHNTNVDGREKVIIALTAIRGIGRRMSTLICKKADIDPSKRAGELTTDEINKKEGTYLPAEEDNVRVDTRRRARVTAHVLHHQTVHLCVFKSDEVAGEIADGKVVAIAQTPTQFKIPTWFLNRQKDVKDGKSKHAAANALDAVWREDLERLKKMRLHRGLRHYRGLKVRGQHTKTTGRHGRTVGVAKKKGC